jgi:hypothetical protein
MFLQGFNKVEARDAPDTDMAGNRDGQISGLFKNWILRLINILTRIFLTSADSNTDPETNILTRIFLISASLCF